MKIYNFENVKNVFVMGDIHGDFKTLLYNLKTNANCKIKINPCNEIDKKFNYNRNGYTKRYRLPNRFNKSIIFVAGDCGFGFNKDVYYQTELVKLNNFLADCEIHIIFIRGNHDDPRFFNTDILQFSNIHCVPDYSIVKTENLTTLCVGGGLSIDRVWRKQQEERINRYNNSNPKRLYWEDEMPVFDKDKLNEIIESKIKIDSIITHTAPSFATPKVKESSIKWIEADPSLKKDIKSERKVMDDIFKFLNDGEGIKFWAYGHFHLNDVRKNYGVLFLALANDMSIFDPFSEIKKYEAKTNNVKNPTPDFLDLLSFDLTSNTLSEPVGGNVTLRNVEDEFLDELIERERNHHEIHENDIRDRINAERERNHERNEELDVVNEDVIRGRINVDGDFEPF